MAATLSTTDALGKNSIKTSSQGTKDPIRVLDLLRAERLQELAAVVMHLTHHCPRKVLSEGLSSKMSMCLRGGQKHSLVGNCADCLKWAPVPPCPELQQHVHRKSTKQKLRGG